MINQPLTTEPTLRLPARSVQAGAQGTALNDNRPFDSAQGPL